MTNREIPCKDRIADELKSMQETAAELLAANGGEPVNGSEYDEDSIYDYGLCVTKKVLIRWEFSTGGPGDWLEIVCDTGSNYGYDVERVVYHINDWFDHAEEEVSVNTPLWELAVWCAEVQYESGG